MNDEVFFYLQTLDTLKLSFDDVMQLTKKNFPKNQYIQQEMWENQQTATA